MTEPLVPSEGWGVLHLFCKVGPATESEAVRTAVKAAEGVGLQVVPFAVLGHKADIGFMALGPDLWRLRALQTDLVAAGLEVRDSYVSLTEVSEYAAGVPEKQKRVRLYPELPPEGMTAFCFYPMTKRRDPEQNWYELPYVLGPGGPAGDRLCRPRRLRVGGVALRRPPRRPQGVRLHDALRPGQRP